MNKHILFIFIITASLNCFGQSIDSYKLSLIGAYLPGGGGRNEVYSKDKTKIRHTASERYRHGRNYRYTSKKQKLITDPGIESTINELDSLFNLTEFSFIINKSLIDSIKAENLKNDILRFSNKDIQNFFSHGDTVFINLNDILPDEFEGTVIDGYPYFFELIFYKQNQDTIRYNFQGNFYDRVQTSNIKYWLPVYIAYKQNKFLETMPMEEYFTEDNLQYVLERFIMWIK